jgi:hypothetical protein
MEVDGIVRCPSGVNSWLWVPFSWLRGGGKEGQQRLEERSTAPQQQYWRHSSCAVVASVGFP